MLKLVVRKEQHVHVVDDQDENGCQFLSAGRNKLFLASLSITFVVKAIGFNYLQLLYTFYSFTIVLR